MIIRDQRTPRGRIEPDLRDNHRAAGVRAVLAELGGGGGTSWQEQNAIKRARELDDTVRPVLNQRFRVFTCKGCHIEVKRLLGGHGSGQGVYCTTKCGAATRYREKTRHLRDRKGYTIHCPTCEKDVIKPWPKKGAPKAVYCSRRCKMTARRERLRPPPVVFYCNALACGKRVSISGRGRRLDRRWCSEACAAREWRRTHPGYGRKTA